MGQQYEREHNIELRRFGFHGISFQYLLDRTLLYLSLRRPINIIAIHLGSGCSLCCIRNNESIDTSMGWTPSEGLIMSTRSGDIDCGLLFALIEQKKNAMSDIKHEINALSGLYGICGTSDMRKILLNEDAEDPNYRIALSMFAYRIKKYIGSYYAVLNGKIDALVFSGGIGQNINHKLLHRFVGDLDALGFVINECSNNETEDVTVWNKTGFTPILSIKTDEELAIAQQIQKKIKMSKQLS